MKSCLLVDLMTASFKDLEGLVDESGFVWKRDEAPVAQPKQQVGFLLEEGSRLAEARGCIARARGQRAEQIR